MIVLLIALSTFLVSVLLGLFIMNNNLQQISREIKSDHSKLFTEILKLRSVKYPADSLESVIKIQEMTNAQIQAARTAIEESIQDVSNNIAELGPDHKLFTANYDYLINESENRLKLARVLRDILGDALLENPEGELDADDS